MTLSSFLANTLRRPCTSWRETAGKYTLAEQKSRRTSTIHIFQRNEITRKSDGNHKSRYISHHTNRTRKGSNCVHGYNYAKISIGDMKSTLHLHKKDNTSNQMGELSNGYHKISHAKDKLLLFSYQAFEIEEKGMKRTWQCRVCLSMIPADHHPCSIHRQPDALMGHG